MRNNLGRLVTGGPCTRNTSIKLPPPLWLPYFPTTAANLLTKFGSPAGWTASNILAIYPCEESSGSIKCSLGLGLDWAPSGSVMYGQATGLKGGKKAIGLTLATDSFRAAGAAFGDANSNIVSVLHVAKVNAPAGNPILCKRTSPSGYGWAGTFYDNRGKSWACATGGTVGIDSEILFSSQTFRASVNTIDDVAKVAKLASSSENTYYGSYTSSAYTGSVTSTAQLTYGYGENGWNASAGLLAYMAFANKEITAAMLQSFWEPIRT